MTLNPSIRGMFMLAASNFAFCGMVCIIRSMPQANVYVTSLFRFIVGMAILGLLALTGKVKLTFVDRSGLFWRGLVGGVSICIGFVSILKLGMIKSSVIVYTYPIFATIFGSLLLKERIGLTHIISMGAAFSGVCMVIVGNQGIGQLMTAFGFFEVLSIAGALLSGLAVVLVRKLQKTDSSASIYFAQCLFGFWLVVVPAGAAPGAVGYAGCALLVGAGVLAAAGQLTMTEGYRYVSVGTGSLLVLMAPVLNVIAGRVLFQESLSLTTIAGSTLVVASCAGQILYKALVGDVARGTNSPQVKTEVR